MALEAVDLSVEVLAVGVTSSGVTEELHIRRGFLFAWSIDARQEIWVRLPKTNSAMATRGIILKPRCARSNSSCWHKLVASGVRMDACGPVEMAVIIVTKGQDGPTAAGQSSSAYFEQR